MGNIDYENYHFQKRLLNAKPTVPQAHTNRKVNRPYKLTVRVILFILLVRKAERVQLGR